MAEHDNTGGGVDDQIAAATSIYEARLVIEAAALAVETLKDRKAPASKVELMTLYKLLRQAGEALEEGHSAMFRLFGVSIGHA